jgi:hypothetical protein
MRQLHVADTIEHHVMIAFRDGLLVAAVLTVRCDAQLCRALLINTAQDTSDMQHEILLEQHLTFDSAVV